MVLRCVFEVKAKISIPVCRESAGEIVIAGRETHYIKHQLQSHGSEIFLEKGFMTDQVCNLAERYTAARRKRGECG